MFHYQYIRRLDQISKDDFLLVGGKASNLGEMIKAGMSVPDGFVVLTSAYKKFVKENNLQSNIQKIMEKLNFNDTAKLEKVFQTIQNWFKDSKIPEDVKNEIALAYKKLGGGAVVIRSSATAEDLPGSSFAGQYDTYLNIFGIEDICEALKKCFASLWNTRAMLYRVKQNISHGELSHAVVVQKLVDGEKAGILFTANPINNRRDQMIINASWGLGEAIVSGEVSPDQWVIDKNTGEIVENNISKKQVMTVRGTEGTINEEVPIELQNKPSLSRKDIKNLIEIGHKTESYFNLPQDIEWVIAGDKVYLLQSRDITTLLEKQTMADDFEWNSSRKGHYLWTNNMVGDVFPEVMTPSTWSMWNTVMGNSFGRHSAIGNIGGRLYFNYSFIYSMMRRFGKNHEQIVKFLEAIISPPPENVDIPIIPISIKTMLSEIIPYQIKIALKQRKLKKNWKIIISSVPARCQKIRNKIKEVREKKDLVSLWFKEVKPLFTQLYYLQDTFNDDFFMPYADLKNKLKKLVTEEKANTFLANMKSNSEELASIGPLLGLLKVKNGKISKEEYIRLYGHRHYNENEFSVPRPEEDKTWLEKQLDEFIESAIKVKESLKIRSSEFEKVLKKLENDHPKEAEKLKEKINIIRDTVNKRESIRSELTRSVAVVRHFFLKAGELTGLDKDIFFLTHQELIDVLSGNNYLSCQYICARKKKYAEYCKLPPYPQFIKGEFNPFEWAKSLNRRSDIYAIEISTLSSPEDNIIKGCAASVGYVEGIVRRIDSPEEGYLLQSGEILVTTTTNIGWTTLFSKAAAVVTDVGAQLSHAAIVAREMGIPAVVGTGNATMYLKTGDRVKVDGSKGIVRIVKKE